MNQPQDSSLSEAPPLPHCLVHLRLLSPESKPICVICPEACNQQVEGLKLGDRSVSPVLVTSHCAETSVGSVWAQVTDVSAQVTPETQAVGEMADTALKML